MKKPLLSITMGLGMILSMNAQDTTFVEIWAKYGENAPEWFTDSSDADLSPAYAATERGIVFSEYNNNHLYVSSRHAEDSDDDGVYDQSEPHVYVLEALTGEPPLFGGLSQLITTGIRSTDEMYGAGYPLNNVTATEDGSILACNMTLAAGPDVNESGASIKAFRVYRWSWEQDQPATVIDYQKGGQRLGDKFSVIGNWDTEAWIYAIGNSSNKMHRWKVTAGVVDEEPTIIELRDDQGNPIAAGTSPCVAPSHASDDWIYVTGRGFNPTLFIANGEDAGVKFSEMDSSVVKSITGTPLAGRTIQFNGRTYMAMFSDEQRALVVDITKQGENVTDVDIIGQTPAFGKEYENAYGEGAVEFGIIDDELYVFVCAPSNGIACYRIDGIKSTGIERKLTNSFDVSVYPNPSRDYANIRFTLPAGAAGTVAIKLYDMTGRFLGYEVADALSGQQEIMLNTSEMPTGQYLYRVVFGQEASQGMFIVE